MYIDQLGTTIVSSGIQCSNELILHNSGVLSNLGGHKNLITALSQ